MNDQDHSILKKVLIGLFVVLVILAQVWFIFFRHTGDKNTPSAQAKTTTSRSQPTSDSKPANNSPNGKSSDNKSGTVAAAETDKLADSGPGETVALFIGVTAFATAAHRFYYTRLRGVRIRVD